MKFTVMGFNQRRLVELGLDCIDALLLRWVVDFYSTENIRKMEINGKRVMWINYKIVVEDLPILGIGKRALADRLQKLVTAGIFFFELEKNSQGTFTYYGINESIMGGLLLEEQRGCCSNSNGGVVKTAPKDSSTKRLFYSNTKKTPTPFEIPNTLHPEVRRELDVFLKMRKEIKKPVKTQRAFDGLLSELHKHSDGDIEMQLKIIKRSIEREWLSFYPLKNESNGQEEAINPSFVEFK